MIDTPSLVTASEQQRELPSGRSVLLRLEGGQEEIEVRSPTGEVEVSIVLTEAGPVVRLTGARLELVAPEAVEIRSKRVVVETSEATELRTEGEMVVTAAGDIDLQGKLIKLN